MDLYISIYSSLKNSWFWLVLHCSYRLLLEMKSFYLSLLSHPIIELSVFPPKCLIHSFLKLIPGYFMVFLYFSYFCKWHLIFFIFASWLLLVIDTRVLTLYLATLLYSFYFSHFVYFLKNIYFGVLGLSCGMQDLHCCVRDLYCGVRDL